MAAHHRKKELLIPLHISITADQDVALEILAERRFIPKAHLIRKALHQYLLEQEIGYGAKVEPIKLNISENSN